MLDYVWSQRHVQSWKIGGYICWTMSSLRDMYNHGRLVGIDAGLCLVSETSTIMEDWWVLMLDYV